MKSVLVTSASGHIGQHLVPLLLSHESKPNLVLPTTNAARLQSRIPSEHQSRVTVTDEGSILDPFFIQGLLEKHAVDTVFLVATGYEEIFIVTSILSACKRSAPTKHVVFLSAAGDFDSPEGRVMVGAGAHASVKLALERTLADVYGTPDKGFTWTVLGPTMFFSNDERQRASVMGPESRFMEPLGDVGCVRVALEDIALAALNAMANPDRWAGKKVNLGTRKQYTDADMARLWGKALGKEVKVNKDLDVLEKHMVAAISPAWARDLSLMYETLGKYGFRSFSEEQYRDQVELLGREPSSYEAFVERVAAEWTKQS